MEQTKNNFFFFFMQFVCYLSLLHRMPSTHPATSPPAPSSHLCPSPAFFFLPSAHLSILSTFPSALRFCILHYLTFLPTSLIFFVYSPLLRTSSTPLLPSCILL